MERALIVEDEPLLSRAIARRLSLADCEIVGVATSGEEAVQMAEEAKPDLVLMDIRLPGYMDGIEAADRIRGSMDCAIVYLTNRRLRSEELLIQTERLKAVADLTGWGDQQTEEGPIEDSGVDAVLAKPVDLIQLLA